MAIKQTVSWEFSLEDPNMPTTEEIRGLNNELDEIGANFSVKLIEEEMGFILLFEKE